MSLVAEGLCVDRGGKRVVHEVSFELAAGEIVALLGPNGAGKSTLLAGLGGTVTPSGGAVRAPGRVASVLQSPGLARRRVDRNVELALAWSGVPRSERARRASDALASMRAEDLARRPARTLSGGEQRRVHLARAVAVRPDVLLLDEPFDGLDPSTHVELRDDTAAALRAAGSAVLVVLHDRRDAWAMADRVAVMTAGRLTALAPPHDLLAAPPSAEVARFLGYDGELGSDGEILLTRACHVRLTESGDLGAVVERAIGTEDGVRVTLRTERGRLVALAPWPGPRAGDDVRVRVTGGVRFPI